MSKLYDCGRLYAVFGRSGDLPCLGIPERLHIQSRSLYEAARSLPSTPANASGAYHLPRHNAAMISRPKAKAYSYTIRVAPPVPTNRPALPAYSPLHLLASYSNERSKDWGFVGNASRTQERPLCAPSSGRADGRGMATRPFRPRALLPSLLLPKR